MIAGLFDNTAQRERYAVRQAGRLPVEVLDRELGLTSQLPEVVTSRLTVTALVPAHNEGHPEGERWGDLVGPVRPTGLDDTIQALLAQTVPFDEIIVVADNCTDDTRLIAASYGVTVIEAEGGSKAYAQNAGLPHVRTDLVLPVDADTLLAPTYLEEILPTMSDPDVAIAAGYVASRFHRTAVERGRTTEYLFGFHWIRSIQQMWGTPIVCSGCCSIFRVSKLLDDFGGFPTETIVEDFDATHRWQIMGHKAVYVPRAEAYAADPHDVHYLNVQMERWMAGFWQNFRMHIVDEIRHRKMLALWMILAAIDIVLVPFWWVLPVVGVAAYGWSPAGTFTWYVTVETCLLMLPIMWAVHRRRLPWTTLCYVPFVWLNRIINQYQALKQFAIEMIGVPLRLTPGLTNYKMGR